MSVIQRTILARALDLVFASPALARDPKELVIGTSAGPYADRADRHLQQEARLAQRRHVRQHGRVAERPDQPGARAAGHRLRLRQWKLCLSDALITEKISPNYINLIALRSADKDKQFAKDIAVAYRAR
jgi:ABC-type metal ion transport system substrate-binding protein